MLHRLALTGRKLSLIIQTILDKIDDKRLVYRVARSGPGAMEHQTQLYSRLEPTEIRLLEITQGDELNRKPGPLQCRLHTVSLKEKPSFCALSYVWGDPNKKTEVLVSPAAAADAAVDTGSDNPNLGKTVQVTVNLGAALDRIRDIYARWQQTYGGSVRGDSGKRRKRVPEFRFWADGLCINQTCEQDRTAQVSLMGTIYGMAELVVAWVQEEGRDVTSGLSATRCIASEIRQCNAGSDKNAFFTFNWLQRYPSFWTEVPGSLETNDIPLVWRDITRFFQHSYWRRVWIFQEVVLARQLLFATRKGWLPWEDLDLTTCFTQEFFERLRQGRVQKPIWLDHRTWEEMAWAFNDLQPFEQIRRARRTEHSYTNNGDMTETLGSWEISLIAGQRLVATDHKDYVYGLLGLSKLPIVPEYSGTKTVWDVYREYAEKWLEHYLQIPRSSSGFSPLAFLSMAGIGCSGSKADESSTSDYSSWAPNFPRKHTTTTKPGGLADSNITIFDETTYAYVENQSLFVSGFRIGLVTSTPMFGKRDDVDWTPIVDYMLDFAHQREKYISGITPLQACVQLIRPYDLSRGIDRTAILFSLAFLKWANRATSFLPLAVQISPDWFESWFLHFFWKGADLDLEALGLKGTLHHIFVEDPDGLLSSFKEALNSRFIDFRGSWRFFETNDAHLGAIPASVERGDCLYILDGCGTPVVLRPNIDHFVFVGTATVAGLMHGEAAELVTLGGLELEKCELR